MTVNSAKSFKGDQTSSSPSKAYDKIVVCNAIQDSHVSEAINKLDAKLENLIALVDKNLHYATKTARYAKTTFFLKFFNGMFVTSTFIKPVFFRTAAGNRA